MNRMLLLLIAMTALGACVKADPQKLNKEREVMDVHTPDLYIDHETGCHYLTNSSSSGGLVPRLTDSGKHICVRPTEAK